MFDWLYWFTDLANSKVFALLLFSTVYCLILLYVYTGKRRKQRLESHKYIPFQEDDAPKDGDQIGRGQ